MLIDSMTKYLTYIPLIGDLTDLVEWLMLINVVLTGAVILFAFRASQYKQQVEELESQINEAIGTTISRHTPEEPVPHRRASRR